MNHGVVCQHADIATFIGRTIFMSVTIRQAVRALSILDEYCTAAELDHVVKFPDKASTHLDSVGERKEKDKQVQ